MTLGLAGMTGAAYAHPHIWIKARAAIVFDDAGEFVAIHNIWTFDEAYSAWAVEGLNAGQNGKVSRAGLQKFADESMQNLVDYGFYTSAGEGSHTLKFLPGTFASARFDGAHLTLDFIEPLAQPYRIGHQVDIAIADPEFYVDIEFPKPQDVTMVNAPAACRMTRKPPQMLPDALAVKLFTIPANVTKIPPKLERELRPYQGTILVTCGSAAAKSNAATNALDAIGAVTGAPPVIVRAPKTSASAPVPAPYPNWRKPALSAKIAGEPPAAETSVAQAVAPLPTGAAAPSAPGRARTGGPVTGATGTAIEASLLHLPTLRPAPFNAPPTESAMILPRTAMFAWIIDAQRAFYTSLTSALARLRTNGNAFWLLGALSFLYGIFHAVGPGHGKIVISSYVLANDQQLRRGLVLSVIAAMLQSTTAVVFILAAALVLHLSGAVMSQMANWMVAGSYALVALLGAWLIVRHIFFGHRHDHGIHDDHHHADANHHAHHHAHVGEDDHLHVVPADRVRGGWREQLAVVVSVGTRPCSGALIVLVFALSQGVLAAGVIAVYLMGAGTAITVSLLALLAVSARGLALRFAAVGGSGVATATLWWVELAGALAVFAFGTLLLLASFS